MTHWSQSSVREQYVLSILQVDFGGMEKAQLGTDMFKLNDQGSEQLKRRAKGEVPVASNGLIDECNQMEIPLGAGCRRVFQCWRGESLVTARVDVGNLGRESRVLSHQTTRQIRTSQSILGK